MHGWLIHSGLHRYITVVLACRAKDRLRYSLYVQWRVTPSLSSGVRNARLWFCTTGFFSFSCAEGRCRRAFRILKDNTTHGKAYCELVDIQGHWSTLLVLLRCQLCMVNACACIFNVHTYSDSYNVSTQNCSNLCIRSIRPVAGGSIQAGDPSTFEQIQQKEGYNIF